mmetsp:Transcript_23211/g.68607  ORF Transcript_23211/g.68607 Transcript_23211/m.68607 type:complete len:519 (-) Transcript_23211:1307-2863(-)
MSAHQTLFFPFLAFLLPLGILHALVLPRHHVGGLGPPEALFLLLPLIELVQIDDGSGPNTVDPLDVPRLDLLLDVLRFVHVELVVSSVLHELSVLDGDDGGGDAADEVSVVGDDAHGPLEVLEGLLEHLLGGYVQMVRRLVEDQEVRRPEHHACEGQPRLLPSGQVEHLLLHGVALEQKLAQERTELVVRLPVRRSLNRLDDVLVQIERIRLILLEVIRDDVLPHNLGGPLVGLLAVHEYAEEGGLAGSVRSQYGDPIVLLDEQFGVVEEGLLERVVPVRVTESLHLGDFRAEAGSVGESESEGFAEERRFLDVILRFRELVQFRLPLLGGLGLLDLELVDPLPFLLDLLLLGVVGGLPRVHARLLQLEETGVIAVVLAADSSLGVDDLGAHLIEEFAVVTDDDHGDVLIPQEILEPLHALQVEMVGRFVQEEDVGFLAQDLPQSDAHLPSAGEHPHQVGRLVLRESHEVHDLLRPTLERVHALRLGLGLKLLHVVQHLLHAIGVGPVHPLQLLLGVP